MHRIGPPGQKQQQGPIGEELLNAWGYMSRGSGISKPGVVFRGHSLSYSAQSEKASLLKTTKTVTGRGAREPAGPTQKVGC